MLEIERYYRIFDLEPGASPEEIHQGYIDLTWVWHPDRFVGHPRLQKKAHHKLQQLNEAHEQLRSFGANAHTRDLPSKPKSQSSSSPHNQSAAQGLHRPKANQGYSGDNRTTVQDCKSHVSVKNRHFDEWLD